MTCCLALAQSGHVLVAADSAATDTDGDVGCQVIVSTPKVYKVKGRLFGLAGDWRAVRLIRALQLGDGATDPLDEAGALVDKLEAEWRRRIGGDYDGQLLVGYSGHVFVVQDDWSLYEPAPVAFRNRNHRREQIQYMAIGRGAPFAIGALSASAQSDMTLLQRAEEALTISSQYSDAVRPPFVHVEA